jgi:hypothetical protein
MSSCSTIEIIRINVEKPAQITLPAYVQNITIVNNAITQPDSINHTIKKSFPSIEVALPADSINTVLTQALAQFMNEEQFYNRVTAYDKSLRESGFFLTETTIGQDEIRRIADETNADAVISLDRFVVQSSLMWRYGVPDLTATMQAKFRVYAAGGEIIGYPISFQDTLYWYDEMSESPLITMKESLSQSAVHTADKMVSMFIPYWQQQNRWFYTGSSKEMREAAKKAMANEWKEAALLWGELYDREEKPLKKALLASNIALANEMLDDVENALTWATISYNLHEESGNGNSKTDFFRIIAFRNELNKRLNEFQRLDKQKRVGE